MHPFDSETRPAEAEADESAPAPGCATRGAEASATPMESGPGASPWRFEAPLDRRGLRLRAGFGAAAAAILIGLASESTHRGALFGTIVALAAATAFAVLAYISWRVARMNAPPLVLDEQGVAFEDGIEPRSFVRWEEIAEIELRRLGFARRVVVTTRGPEDREMLIPVICHGGSPPEWTAGLLETFRQHALHR